MNYRQLIVNTALVTYILFPLTASAYDLQDAMYETIKTHPEILSAKSRASALSSEIDVEHGGLFPSLDISAGIGRENSNNPATRATGSGTRVFTRKESEIFLQQLLFDGGNVRGRVKQRRFQFESSKYQVSEIKQNLGFAAVTSYYNIMRFRDILLIRKMDVKAHQDMLQKVKDRILGGAGRKSELNLAKSRLALSKSRLESAERDLENAETTFIQVVGHAAPKTLTPPEEPKVLPTDLKSAEQIALQINPSLNSLSAQVHASAAEVGIAESAFYPRITLDLSANHSNNLDGITGRNEDKMAMLRMTYNVLNGGSDLAKINATKAQVRASSEELINARRNVIESVGISWNELQAAKDRIPYLQQHRDESLAVYKAYVEQFKLGQRTLFDLLNTQSEYYNARVNYISGRYDKSVTKFRLLASIGDLVEVSTNTACKIN